MFTIVLIVLAAVFVIAVLVHEVRTWRKPGRQISQQASMDSDQTNTAHLTHHTNIHNDKTFGSGPSSM